MQLTELGGFMDEPSAIEAIDRVSSRDDFFPDNRSQPVQQQNPDVIRNSEQPLPEAPASEAIFVD